MRCLAAVLASAMLWVGCGENCQETCTKIYDPSQCAVQPGGVTPQQLIRECSANCEQALSNTGPMGDYDPNVRRDPLNPKNITNEKQAAAWMECVAEATCEELQPAFGLCEPI